MQTYYHKNDHTHKLVQFHNGNLAIYMKMTYHKVGAF